MDIQTILSELKKEGWYFNEDFIKNNEDMLQAIADKTLALQLQQTGVVGRSEQLIAFLKWVGDGYDFENNAEKIVNEYIDKGD